MSIEVYGKKVLVIGLARSGVAVAKVLSGLGAQVTVYDGKSRDALKVVADEVANYATLQLGEKLPLADLYDFVVVSPGVPLDIPYIEALKAIGNTIIGEIELAYQLASGTFTAITGTNGKTTTTALVGAMFDRGRRSHKVVGNIGMPAISETYKAGPETVFVTELSSFQLESIVDFRAPVAAILNVTPDHLNRHKTMENYIAAKMRIFENQTKDDALILNLDDPIAHSISKYAKSRVFWFSMQTIGDQGAFLKRGRLITRIDGKEIDYCSVDDMKIFGDHNIQNALAAILIAQLSGIENGAITAALKEFPGVEHRIEFVRDMAGISFYNDSKATNPDAALSAIRAMKVPTHLIAGGMDKGNQFDILFDAFGNTIKSVTVFGETKDLWLKTAFEKGYSAIEKVSDLDEAVAHAYKNASCGEAVLLSPACASWDMYESYEKRGAHFKAIVNAL